MTCSSTLSTNTGIIGTTSCTPDPLQDQSSLKHWSSSSSAEDSSQKQEKDNILNTSDLLILPHSPACPHQCSSLSSDSLHPDHPADDWFLVSASSDRDSDHGQSVSPSLSSSGATTLKTAVAP